MNTLYIDESKARGYLLAGAVIPDVAATAVRQALNALRLNGQSRIHMAKENDSRRRAILARLCSAGVIRTHLWEIAGKNQTEAREACLRAAARSCRELEVHRLVIERDDSLVKTDRATLLATLTGGPVTYVHLQARVEPLLSVPDAVAWSHCRRGEWALRKAPLIASVTRLS